MLRCARNDDVDRACAILSCLAPALQRTAEVALRTEARYDAALPPPSLRAKRSNPESLRGGILDCFVASLLAMTAYGAASPSSSTRLDSRTRLHVLAALFARALLRRSTLEAKRAQGRPGADNAPAVCCAKCTRRRTAQQHTGGADHSAFPARWSDGLCRALPGAEFLLASLAFAEITSTRAG